MENGEKDDTDNTDSAPDRALLGCNLGNDMVEVHECQVHIVGRLVNRSYVKLWWSELHLMTRFNHDGTMPDTYSPFHQ